MADAKVTDPALLAQLNGTGGDAKVTDPEVLAALNADVHPDDAGAFHYIRSALQAADPYVRSAANALTLGLADRIAAGAGAATGIGGNAGDYSGNLQNEQAKTDEFATAHPYVNAGIQAGGGLATLPFLPEAAALKGASLGTKALVGAGAGAGIGGVQGAISSRDLTDIPQTAKDAGIGAVFGGALGAGVPVVGKGIGTGLNWLVDTLRTTPGISRGAAKVLMPAVEADGAGAIGSKLDQLGPDAMLADAGPALQGKAQGAVLNSDQAKSTLNTALKARNAGTDARIQSDVNAALGPAEDPQTVSNAILAHRSAVDNEAYPAALNNAAPVDIGNIVDQLDKHIPRTVGNEQKALESLRNMLTKPAPTEAPSAAPAAAATPATPAPDATVQALRAKYGDAVADAYQRQNQPAATSLQNPQGSPSAPSLLQFLASKGGLGPDAELDAIGAHSHTVNVDGVGRRKLVRQGGLPLDSAREAAEEAGYFRGQNNQTSGVNDLLDAIDNEMRGQKLYPEGAEGTVSKREQAAMSEREQHELDARTAGFEDDLADAGHGELGPDVKQRAINLMANQGMDADTAVNHALAQLDQEDAARPATGFPGDRKPAPAPQKGAPERVPKDDAQALHNVKQELDNVINYDAPGLGVPAGAVQRQQGALKWFRAQLNNALESQVPGYREANATSHALANRAEAVQAGTKYLGSGKTTPSPGRFADEFNPLSQGEKIAFAKGSRGDIERVLGTKANDLEALRGELQGEGGWNTAKIATVHGQDAADALMSTVNRNRVFRDTFNKVVENSQSAQRLAAAKSMKPEANQAPLISPNSTTTGMAATVAKKAAIGIANALLQKDPTKSYAEVAKILAAQGPQARTYLNALAKTLQQRAAQSPALNRAGDRLSLAAALGASRIRIVRDPQPDQTFGR